MIDFFGAIASALDAFGGVSDSARLAAQYAAMVVAKLKEAGLSPTQLVETIEEAVKVFSGRMADAGMPILSVCLGIRLVIITFKELIDGDLVDLLGEYIGFAAMAIILLLMITAWASDGNYSVPAMAADIQKAVLEAAGGDPLSSSGLFDSISTQFGNLFGAIWGVVGDSIARWIKSMQETSGVISGMAQSAGPLGLLAGGFLGNFGNQALLLTVVINFALALIASIAVILMLCFLLYHMLSGFIAIQVAVAFGPLALAAYPLIDSWAKKVVSTMATGIVQLAAAVLLIEIVSEILEKASTVANSLSAIT